MEELKTIGGLAQLGSFGLLCMIAYWVMRQVPKWLEQLATERANSEQAKILVAGENRQVIHELILNFNAQTKYEREECEKKHKELIDTYERRHQDLIEHLEKSYDVIREVKHEVSNVAHSRALDKVVQEERQKEEKQREEAKHRTTGPIVPNKPKT